MNRNEWLDLRRSGIGGTDVAAICGVHPYRTPLDVYLDKLGIAPATEENEAMRWGHIMEPIIAQEVTDRTHIAWTKGTFFRSERNSLFCGTPDYVNEDIGMILECKTCGVHQDHRFGDIQTDFVPDEYLLQTQWYMFGKQFPCAKLTVLIGGNELRIYDLKADENLHNLMAESAMRFWRDHVETQTPPPLDASESSKVWLKHAFPRNANDNICPATDAEEDLINVVYGWRRDLDKAESEYEAAKNRLCEMIGDRAGLLTRDGRCVTWKATKGSDRIDYKGIVATLDPPIELIRQHTQYTEGSRRFLLTEAKGK